MTLEKKLQFKLIDQRRRSPKEVGMCKPESYVQISYCGEYGKKECPMTCHYAKERQQKENKGK